MTVRRFVEMTPDGIGEELIFHGDGSFAIRRFEDVEPIVERNKALQTAGDGYSATREWRRVASIPVTVQMQWINRYGVDPLAKGNEALLKRLLNDPEWRHLRTSPGRV
jgi:hypothetical protein